MRGAVAAAFDPHGELAGAIAGFVARSSQRELALAVFDAITERGTLVAEAGTGTGKTFAYLVPALLAGGKLLVSAGTKTLQDQIFNKDLAAMRQALGLRIDVALLKGRQNYVCLHRLANAAADGSFVSRDEVRHLREVVRFARVSASGDRVELAAVPEGAPIWPAVTSTRDNCLGTECPRFDDCFVYKARRQAQAADVVVVNHHLFLADLAMRDDALGELLPDVDAVILDEAHQLPRIAAEFFGSGWSLAQVGELARDARVVGLGHARDGADWVPLTQQLDGAVQQVRLAVAKAGVAPAARTAIERLHAPGVLVDRLAALATAVDALQRALAANVGRAPDLDLIGPRCQKLADLVGHWQDALTDVDRRRDEDDDPLAEGARAGADAGTEPGVDPGADPAGAVRWIAATAHGASFHETPLAPAAQLARAREARPQAWILTSATLTVAGRFDQFLAEVGLPAATTARWDSPFDYARQGLLYLPLRMPSPNAEDFPERVADAVWPVVQASGGRAFVLCATLRNVERAAARLGLLMQRDRTEMPLFVQGSSTRRALLEAFRGSGNGILVGSVSFWEGIDVRGDALSVVAIDKLPFAPPDDPVVEARIRRLKALQRNPFMEYQLPQAITLLRQGAGRLIRDERDRGVLMLLDERIVSKAYGRTVLASLPPFRVTRDVRDVSDFFTPPPAGTGG